MIGALKTVSTEEVNLLKGTPGARLWQRGFYEHIIRTERELARIREYITNNPAQWSLDRENPDRRQTP
jgi:REP element-mobilizing transposase RayT